MTSLLDQLKTMTVVVSDSGDFNSIAAFKPRDATTNPSLILQAAGMSDYSEIVDSALRWAKTKGGTGGDKRLLDHAIDRLSVEFGLKILSIIPGRVSTEIDGSLSYDTAGSIEKAKLLIAMYEDAGMSRERILIKLASTWEGIKAAEQLEKEGIHCNLTLLFGIHQAVACADAKVTLVSPFVGRILDWYKKSTGKESYAPAEDPGVVSVTEIYDYYKKHGHETEVMGASFRSKEEIIELAGCDLLTISPKLLGELQKTEGHLTRKLDPDTARSKDIPVVTMDETTFRAAHEKNRMAFEQLDAGIKGFAKARDDLEAQLKKLLAA